MTEQPPAPTDPTPPRGTPLPLAEPIATIPPSLTQPPQQGLRSNPQIVAAVITGVISLLVAVVGILPAILKSDDDDPTPTPQLAAIIVTVMPTNIPPSPLPPATDTPAPLPTDTAAASVPTIVSVDQNTPLPVIGATLLPQTAISETDTGAPTAQTVSVDSANEPNIRLYFDNASFTIRNQGGGKKTLSGVVFTSDSGAWEASQWGNIHRDLSNRDCLRIRYHATEPRDPPSECKDLLALLLVGEQVLFWRDNDGFRVERNGALLGICTTSPCDLYLPRD